MGLLKKARRPARARALQSTKHSIFQCFDALLSDVERYPAAKPHRSFVTFNRLFIGAYAQWLEDNPLPMNTFPCSRERLMFVGLLWWKHIHRDELLPRYVESVGELRRILLNGGAIRQEDDGPRRKKRC